VVRLTLLLRVRHRVVGSSLNSSDFNVRNLMIDGHTSYSLELFGN